MAATDEVGEFVAKGMEVGDLALNFREMLLRDRIHRLAGAVLLVGQPQQLAHLIEREG
jgi:hypothetical protein